MNCPECKHPSGEHSDIGCAHEYKNHRICKCSVTDDEIELDNLHSHIAAAEATIEEARPIIEAAALYVPIATLARNWITAHPRPNK